MTNKTAIIIIIIIIRKMAGGGKTQVLDFVTRMIFEWNLLSNLSMEVF